MPPEVTLSYAKLIQPMQAGDVDLYCRVPEPAQIVLDGFTATPLVFVDACWVAHNYLIQQSVCFLLIMPAFLYALN